MTVDQNAALGIGIGHRPAAVIVAGENRVVAGDRSVIDPNITGFTSADDVFPMGQRMFASVRHVQPCPDFRFPFKKQQRFQTPQQNKKGQNRRRIAQKADVHIHIGLFRIRKKQKHFFHVITSIFLFLIK